MATDQSHKQMGQSVGAKIRAARQKKKYTQSQLASPDFSVSYISAIERGQIQPSLRALEILAQRLEISSTQLLPEYSQPESGEAIPGGSLKEEEVITLGLLEAQILILQDSAGEALVQLEKLIKRNLQDQHQTQLHYLRGWAYLLTDQLQKCEDALIEAEKLANVQKDTYISLHTQNLLGLAYAAMHNHYRAVEAHQTCLKLLESAQPRDPFFLCHVYNQLGHHYTYLDELKLAVEMFKQAVAITEELVVLKHVQSIYWDICQYYASIAEHHLASLYSHKCLHLYSQQNGRLRSELYYYLGRAMMKSGQEEVRAYLEEALQGKNNRQEPLVQASITIRLAEWFLVHNALKEAEKHARHAAELVKAAGDSIIAAEVQLIWGRILYAQAKYKKGDEHFDAGLEILEHQENYEELANQFAFYAHLLDESNQPQKAITYYKRAYESRQKMGESG